MEFNELTEEQKEKARACKTSEDLIELAKSEGVELSDADLENIAGGSWSSGCSSVCNVKEYFHSPRPQKRVH